MKPTALGLFTMAVFAALAVPAFGQVFPSTVAGTRIDGGLGEECNNSNSKKSVCQGTFTTPNIQTDGGTATAIAGYGKLKIGITSFLELLTSSGSGTFASSVEGSVQTNDILSLVGLTAPAYLRLEGSLSYQAQGLGSAQYYISVVGFADECVINNTTPPSCTLSVPVTPGVGVELQRNLAATASNIILCPCSAGSAVSTVIYVGYPSGDGNGATLRVSVRDAEGHLIKGISVVGASGHIYN